MAALRNEMAEGKGISIDKLLPNTKLTFIVVIVTVINSIYFNPYLCRSQLLVFIFLIVSQYHKFKNISVHLKVVDEAGHILDDLYFVSKLRQIFHKQHIYCFASFI
jgi:hypothetical protein